ncbi:MAG: rhodanese-like domain-containing protein [Oscillospiraceae bacterium]|nr:rhodanese-like domain-containing protein [Oscillospiraceae bacterium]
MKILILILCGIVLLAISGCCSTESKISMENNAVLLDVRTPEEHKSGYLEGAVLLPLAELESKISSKVADKNTPVYIYCRSGRRAGTAVETLKAMGYTDLHNLGGLKDARKKLDLPISK